MLKKGLLKILVKLRLFDRKKLIRKDVEIIPIQPHVELEVYWKILEIGKGPAVILRAFDKKIMKFDIFGREKGHYHVAPDFDVRIDFEEEKAIDQIREAKKFLITDTQKYLNFQSEEKIKSIRIDNNKLSEAAQKAEVKMIYFLQNVPSFKELR